MPGLDDLIVSVSGRLVHQWDFAFYKNNGEIANRMRRELGSALKEISLDSDGDIDLRTDQGTFYVTPAGVVAAGWLTNSKSLLSGSRGTEEFAQVIELLANAKGSFAPEGYSVRLFFRFTPESGLRLIGARGFESVLRSILGDKTPSDVKSYKFSSKHDKGEFSDSIELEASAKDVQLRYSRDWNGTGIDSYRAFLEAVDLTGLIEDLKPFAEVLVAAQPRLGRGLFGTREKQSR
jgi:hypothetical protein